MNIVIRGEPSVYTQESILMLDDDKNNLFEIILDKEDNLSIFGIDRMSSRFSIKPRAANSIVVKIER